jgi:hypothetical protein
MRQAREQGPRKRKDSSRSLRRDAGGAIYVEFLATFLPLTIVFLGLAQSSGLYAAKLITAHAAVMGARAAAVVIPDDPKYYDSAPGVVSGKRRSAIEKAVGMTLKANGSIIAYNVEVEGTNGQPKDTFDQGGGFQQATVRVRATYMCNLSIASWVVCGSFAGITTLEETASMPVHMASYEYPE